MTFHDVAVSFNTGEELLNNRLMTRICGANETVIADLPCDQTDSKVLLIRSQCCLGRSPLILRFVESFDRVHHSQ